MSDPRRRPRGGRPPRERGNQLVTNMNPENPDEIQSIEYLGHIWLPHIDAEHGPVFVRQGGSRPGPMLRMERRDGGWNCTLISEEPS